MRMVKGLANKHAAELVAARGDHLYASVDELWRRARVPLTALQRLAEADALRGLGLERREALWAIRGLRDDVLPLFATADARRNAQAEIVEPAVSIVPMTAGRNVVEDYSSVGLTLRQHPVAFLRDDLRSQRVMPCGDLLTSHDGQRVTVAGLVLVRQRPGTATGVIFVTIEDETGIANLVVWSSLFDRQRRVVLSASMLKCRGRVQREGDVIHVVGEQLEDLSSLLRSVGDRQQPFPVQHGRGDGVTHQNGPDPRATAGSAVATPHTARFADQDQGIRVHTRSFR
jgi:error-prone DNA polymerase